MSRNFLIFLKRHLMRIALQFFVNMTMRLMRKCRIMRPQLAKPTCTFSSTSSTQGVKQNIVRRTHIMTTSLKYSILRRLLLMKSFPLPRITNARISCSHVRYICRKNLSILMMETARRMRLNKKNAGQSNTLDPLFIFKSS